MRSANVVLRILPYYLAIEDFQSQILGFVVGIKGLFMNECGTPKVQNIWRPELASRC